MRDQLDPDHWCNGGEYGSSHPDALAMEALDAENKQLRAEVERLREAQRWIPAEERLPEQDGDYLVMHLIGPVICEFDLRNQWFSLPVLPVTHWMPLPEPPNHVGGATEKEVQG